MSAQRSLADVLRTGRVIAVVTIGRAADALALADALHAGGIRMVEIALRTPAALDALERIAAQRPDTIVGAGTVRGPSDLRAALGAGARFVVSPGFTPALHATALAADAPWLPGVATASEILVAQEAGRDLLKFFPADVAGGPHALRTFATVFPEVRFCPTGGVAAGNLRDYLDLPNVACVAGSWVAPPAAIEAREWQSIQSIAREAVDLSGAG